MNKIVIIGTIAAVCTTISFLPQVIKIYHTKHTSDLSLPMYVIFSFGIVMWLWYGFMTNSLPIILANAVTFVLAVYILAAKIKYK